MKQTIFERKLEAGLKEILPAPGKPTHFVVKMKGMKMGVGFRVFLVDHSAINDGLLLAFLPARLPSS
jgi:hypothetical protein